MQTNVPTTFQSTSSGVQVKKKKWKETCVNLIMRRGLDWKKKDLEKNLDLGVSDVAESFLLNNRVYG